MDHIYVTPDDRLQKIFDNAKPGSVIHLSPGVYRQKTMIRTPGLTILGAGEEKTRIVYDDYARKRGEDGFEYITFRPEAAQLGEKEDAYILNATVELTEMLGDNTNVYVNIGQTNAILKVNPHDTPALDARITFFIPAESVYLFDAETEMVIR